MDAERWRTTTLGEIVNLKRGYDLPKRLRTDGPIPIVSSSGVTGTHTEAKVQPPGVVTGRYGTLGSIYYLDQPFWPLNTTLYVQDFKGNEERFVAYLLESLDLGALVSSAAVPGINRNHLHPLQVQVPDRALQSSIAKTLGVFDDLIENNRRRIEILEEMARLLYREWFVHFRFPGHEDVELVDSDLGSIPEGWEWKNLFELAEVGFGFSFKSKRFAESGAIRVVRIRDVPRNTTSTYTDEDPGDRYEIHDGDVLIGMDGDFHMCRWADGLAHLNQRVARLRSKGQVSQLHLHLALEQPIQRFNQTIIGTTVAHLGKRHLEEIFIAEPSPPVFAAVSKRLQAIHELELNLRKQNRLLREARDLLLPRLVSGELDVSELDFCLERVGA